MSPLINKPPALSCFLIKENTPSENWEQTRGLNGEGWKRIFVLHGVECEAS